MFRLNFVLVFSSFSFSARCPTVPFPFAVHSSSSCLVCCRSSPSLRSSAPPSPRRAWPQTREPSEPCSTSPTTRQREVRPSAAHPLHGSPFAAPMQRVQGGVQILGQPARRVGGCAHGRTVVVDRSDGRPRSAVRPDGDGGEFARPLHRARVDVQRIDCSSAHVCVVCAVAVVVAVADRCSCLQSSSSSFTLVTSSSVWWAAASSSDTPAMCSLESPRMRQHTPSTMYEIKRGRRGARGRRDGIAAASSRAWLPFSAWRRIRAGIILLLHFLRVVCSPACVHRRRWWLLAVRVCACSGSVQLLEAQPRGRRQLVARSPVPVLRVQLVQAQ